MKVQKAVITASGRPKMLYPTADAFQRAMIPLVDVDGMTKPIVQIIAEQAIDAGITEIAIVCSEKDKEQYISAFETLLSVKCEKQSEKLAQMLSMLTYTVQPEPVGYADAVYRAKDFVGDSPFLLLLSDHLYISNDKEKNCASQIIDLALKEQCSVSAVNPTREHLVQHYGTLTGDYIASLDAFKVIKILEKPSITTSEIELLTPGLRAGFYLCLFGMHVLMPRFFDILKETKETSQYITSALQTLADSGKYFAKNVNGQRYNIGIKYGLLTAQMALALNGAERDEMLFLLSDTLIKDKRNA